MKTILVAGGAGYIGSHMVALLAERGIDTVVVDNLCTGHQQTVKGARKTYIGDLRDGDFLDTVFAENEIDGVINFAAFRWSAKALPIRLSITETTSQVLSRCWAL